MTQSSAGAAPFLLRDPTLSETHIAFSFGGNIWIAKRDGSELRRLTSGGYEAKPAFSPDGKHIAFAGEYGGPRGVFLMPVGGGEPRRLTYHPDDLGERGAYRHGDCVAWTPDGKSVLFSSRRAAFVGGAQRITQLFTIGLHGGAATAVPLVRAVQGSLSPDGTRIAYVPNVQWNEWKRYRGGETTPIWIADLATSRIEATIPRDNSNDSNPLWVGDTIYFLSDRNGPTTLFSYNEKSKQVRQVVENDGMDIKSAAVCSDTMAYDQFGSLHLLNLRTGEDRVLDIRPAADFPEVRPRYKNLLDIVGVERLFPEIKPVLSPTGARAAFAVHGEILTVSAAKGEVRNLTQTPGAVERDPAWSPDGSRIAYFCDESGEYALHIREVSGFAAVRKIELGHPPSFYYSPVWSPDGRKIAYVDKRLNYWYVDLDAKTPVLVDTDLFVDSPNQYLLSNARRQVTWSPDSRWIAYTKTLESRYHAVFVHSIETTKSYSLTDGMSDALYVAFDRNGQYLYFTASTDVGFASDWTAMSSFHRSVTRGVYALLLRAGIPTPLIPESDEDCAPMISGKSERVEIDLEGVSQRVIRLPLAPLNYLGLFAGRPGILFLAECAVVESSWQSRRLQNIHRFDLGNRKSERILQEVSYFDLSLDGEKMLYAKADSEQRRRWFITSTQSTANASRQSNDGLLRLDAMQVHVDPRMEWKHMFEQAWRAQRDFFYDPQLHGLHLEAIKKKYAPFIENIVTHDDLDYLFGEMLSNLTVGHMWAEGPPDVRRKRAKTGLLGADFSVEQGRYRFAHIYEGDLWGTEVRAPLLEPGKSVKIGEYLLAVNGRDVRPTIDVFSYFEETAGTQVMLRVGPRHDGTDSREILVVPIDDEYTLRYFAWIEGNRRRVHELTGGRVAYVHVPDCNPAGYAAFNRYFFAQVGREALIVDARYNNGGQMPDYYIECLRRPLLCYWHGREGRDWAEPSVSIFGPKVMLTNEKQGSMGDVLAWAFRKTEIGPLVGKRTWGGTVGFYTFPDDALDDGWVATPNMAFYTPDGAWEIENAGVSPDIEVDEDPMAARVGRDVQLERAVEVVMDLLKKTPAPPVPQHPQYPNHHHGR